MPIAITDYEWIENESFVFITVPLKGAKCNKVDIISNENYIKVSLPPYLFECFLFSPTDDDQNLVQISKGVATFKLCKIEQSLWHQLQIDDIDNKAVTKEIRNAALVAYQEKLSQQHTERVDNKRSSEKFALNEMMKLENDERERIENEKQTEREKANRELEEWKSVQVMAANQMKNKLLQERIENERLKKENIIKEQKESEKGMFNEGGERPAVIATRNPVTIEVTFTPRHFPTPVRESSTPQEEEWLKKQAEMRNIRESMDKDLSQEERNPVWLRDKGNGFFQSGDIHAAINAYSQAIRLESHMPSLYSNRAACHMKLGNYMKCIEDCSKALDNLTPPVPQNLKSRCKAIVRRGTAFCHLELYVEGLQEYEVAIKLDPTNEGLKQDADKIRRIIEGSSHSDM